jgi:hypothetical protein
MHSRTEALEPVLDDVAAVFTCPQLLSPLRALSSLGHFEKKNRELFGDEWDLHNTPQPADEVILHLSLSYKHALQVSL